MRFRLCSFLIILIVLLPCTVMAAGENDSIDLNIRGERVYNDSVDKAMSGKLNLNGAHILNSVGDILMGEVKDCAGDMTLMLIVAALSGIITTVSKSFETKGMGEAAFFTCFTLLSAAAVKCFHTALGYGSDVIGSMTDFITKLTPVVMLTLAAGGATVSAAAFQPVLSGAVYVVTLLTDKCLIPLATFGAVLSVAGNINEDIGMGRFIKLVKSLSVWIITAVMTVFTGITAVYGMSSPSLDAVGGKAAKYAVSTVVPVVGGFLSDTMETVVASARLMKNSVGTAGIIALCVIVFMPAIKIGVIQLMLKITAAVAEPLTDKRISAMMWSVSESVTMVFAMVAMVAVMFILNIGIIMAATNLGV